MEIQLHILERWLVDTVLLRLWFQLQKKTLKHRTLMIFELRVVMAVATRGSISPLLNSTLSEIDSMCATAT